MEYQSTTQSSTDLAPFINQAILNPHIDQEVLYQNCDGAKNFGFAGLCTNLILLPTARKRLGTTGSTKLIAVISFPFGAIPSPLKQLEAEWAAENGAEELDVVPNFFALNQGKIDTFAEEISKICSIGLPVNLILNVNNLNAKKLSLAVEAGIDAGINGVQSGNGFGPAVSKGEIVNLKELTKGRCAIQAAGGLNSISQAYDLLEAGACKLGTSRGFELIKSLKHNLK